MTEYRDDDPVSPEEQAKYEAEFLQSATNHKTAKEQDWQQNGIVFAWIDAPEWVSAIEWELHGILPRVETPQTRTFRLSLLGGGQVKIAEKYVDSRGQIHVIEDYDSLVLSPIRVSCSSRPTSTASYATFAARSMTMPTAKCKTVP
jgi:hypothetical protein